MASQSVPQSEPAPRPQQPQASGDNRKLTDKNSYSLHDRGDSYQNVLIRLGMANPKAARP